MSDSVGAPIIYEENRIKVLDALKDGQILAKEGGHTPAPLLIEGNKTYPSLTARLFL